MFSSAVEALVSLLSLSLNQFIREVKNPSCETFCWDSFFMVVDALDSLLGLSSLLNQSKSEEKNELLELVWLVSFVVVVVLVSFVAC